MEKWKLTYELYDRFSSPVNNHHYSLRCFPASFAADAAKASAQSMPQKTEVLCGTYENALQTVQQTVGSLRYMITPEGTDSFGADAFGNTVLSGCIGKPHTEFMVKVEAEVETSGAYLFEPLPYHRLGMYRYASAYTAAGERLTAFSKRLQEEAAVDQRPWVRTAQLLEALWNHFRYLRGSTGFCTTAEQAFAQGCGVCQDYAHILLSLCRMEGMTARYVTGAIPGEGQSHAWIEVWQDGYWKGFDPTNRKETDGSYIRFAHGRDALDCELVRGIYFGSVQERQQVYVRMEETETDERRNRIW